jgi:hypothetical protein
LIPPDELIVAEQRLAMALLVLPAGALAAPARVLALMVYAIEIDYSQ